MINAKTKFPRKDALVVAWEVVKAVEPVCERLVVAGSLRRRKEHVGDVEIVYVPKTSLEPDGLFDQRVVNLVDRRLETLLRSGALAKRLNAAGRESWGDKNKLALHMRSGVPVDLFETSLGHWWNYVVCRTGGAECNVSICQAAQRKGWKWHPYGAGFTDEQGNLVRVECEEDVFRLVGLPYLQPWER